MKKKPLISAAFFSGFIAFLDIIHAFLSKIILICGLIMTNQINRVVIVGGGSAGWLSAGIIAAKRVPGLQITLVESPDIKPIGVGEGTWPSMRATLETIGISETDFLRECDASFKQGSKFSQWATLSKSDDYYHPFSLPIKYREFNLAPYWLTLQEKINFATAVSAQSTICDSGLGPKQITTPEYEAITNYGYHLDAGKFAPLLHRHCVEKLGVQYIRDNVTVINNASDGDISSVTTQANGDIEGNLFIDCTGLSSLLLGTHFNIPFVSKREYLFNDTALAAQIPYLEESNDIASHTMSTAQTAGWIWDIGLTSRRGVGHVFSSAHISDDAAELELRNYIGSITNGKLASDANVRKLKINPGYREVFWHKNCVAIGLSAGFIEPLEATALVLIELSAKMVSDQFPSNKAVMPIVAKRFNQTFSHHWERIIDFLKLHYILTKREDSDYWIDNCRASSIPESLRELMELWKYRSPWICDEIYREEMFPSASYQYIIYGMKYETKVNETLSHSKDRSRIANDLFTENFRRTQQLVKVLTPNRELLEKIKQYGLQKI